jgi:uncharacterized protein YecA (UPF0149 family)
MAKGIGGLGGGDVVAVGIHEALAENRVDLYLQPVVSLPQRRTIFYESFTRLRAADDRVMMPAEYLSAAEGEVPATAAEEVAQQPVVKSDMDKTPRNAPCPCGSGKKYKQCHGAA